jgi:CheY-like chemotaxis protein
MVVEDSDIRPVDVLLVEDNPADVELTQRILRDSNHALNVTVAQDGEEAMAVLRKAGAHAETPTPELVLLDLNMPRMNGYEVLQEMSQSEDLNRIQVLILTSTQAERDRLQFSNVSPNRYCTKPLPITRFNDILGWLRSEEYVSWFALGAQGVQEREPAMLEKFSEIARLADRDRSDRVAMLLRAEHDMLADGIRGIMASKLRVLLQMDEEAAKNIATSYSGAVQLLSSEQAMLHVAISQRLSQDFSEEDRDRLLAIDPRLFGARPQPARAPRQETAPPAPRRWWWPFGG